MLRNLAIVLVLAACLCVIPPAIGWFESGEWAYAGFSIGGLLDSVSLSDKLGPLQPFIDPIRSANPGWLLLFVGLICFMLAGNRGD